MFGSFFGDAPAAEKSSDTTDADEVAALKQMLSAPATAPAAAEAASKKPEGEAPVDVSEPVAPAKPSAPISDSAVPSQPKKATVQPKSKGASPTKGKAATPNKARQASPPPGAGSPPKHDSISYTSFAHRPKWNDAPLRNPPGAVRGLKPVTNEPWNEVALADNALRMNFGSKADMGEVDDNPFEHNGFVEEARRKREQNARQAAWDGSPVKHMPPSLRGQKTVRRAEPWSQYHDDSIEELNAVEGVSINEIYAVTADRDNKVKSTINQPAWDGSEKLGRRAYKPGGAEAARAKSFREARKPGKMWTPPV